MCTISTRLERSSRSLLKTQQSILVNRVRFTIKIYQPWLESLTYRLRLGILQEMARWKLWLLQSGSNVYCSFQIRCQNIPWVVKWRVSFFKDASRIDKSLWNENGNGCCDWVWFGCYCHRWMWNIFVLLHHIHCCFHIFQVIYFALFLFNVKDSLLA